MAHRFFSPSKSVSDNKIIIDNKKQVHYIKDVLRLKANDSVVIFDDKGREYDCVIAKISSMIVLNIQAKRLLLKQQKGPSITVACAIPKKSKMDEIVDKLTQLGVDKIIPLLTERVIVKWDKQKKMLQQKRWEKIALCASQQSQRSKLAIIEPVKDIKEVLSESEGFDLRLIPTLTGERKSFKEILAKSKAQNILVLIGPEGDFAPQEVKLAVEAGCIPLSLGELVLRVDTAAVAATSFIRLYADR